MPSAYLPQNSLADSVKIEIDAKSHEIQIREVQIMLCDPLENRFWRLCLQNKVEIPNFVSGPREYIMEGEYVILVMCSWFRNR